MRIETYLCDKEGCKRERAGNSSLTAFIETTPDGSGNGYDHWYAIFDLCPADLLLFTNELLTGIFETNPRLKLPDDIKTLLTRLKIRHEVR